MPGSYAHITSVNDACDKRRLLDIKGFPREAIDAASLHFKFVELGCISPDYPYLDLLSADSKSWADAMHYTHTCKAIYEGANAVRGLPQGIAKDKCLAWHMGYTAHVIADMCVHPIVELKVGPYKGHETAHRKCEMHQDVYIFRRIGTTMPQTAEHIKASILKCGDPKAPHKLDPDIKGVWEKVLKTVHPELFVDDPPDLDKWHKRCYDVLEKLLPATSRFVGFARHVCNGLAFDYPTLEEVDRAGYIDNLKVPAPEGIGKRMKYDDIFDFAVSRIQQVWLDVTRYTLGYDDQIVFRDDEWNLDTGKNELLAQDQSPIFWDIA
jgi:hypothetical protein